MNFREIAEKAAREAGVIIRANFKRDIKIERKQEHELVSEVDRKVEKKIREIIQRNFPDHSILGEEFGEEEKESEYTWIIDPIDGTTNFLMKNPFFNTSIALAKGKEPIVGVVYNPIADELFSAEKDEGAFLNGEEISVSEKKKLSDSLITYCHGKTNESVDGIVPIFHKFKRNAVDIRQLGAGALELCYVASGRVEAFVDNGVYPWDAAAGILILREAGGKATDFSGEKWDTDSKTLVASNGKSHPEILEQIQEVI